MHAPSVDPGEVEYYSRLAAQWWDSEGPFWPLHRLNQLRVIYLQAAICEHFNRKQTDPGPLTGLKILDIGCGGGILAESMAALGASVTGVDVVERNIIIAREHALQSGFDLNYEYISVEQLSSKNERFDVVLNMEVVEHVEDLSNFMAHCTTLVADEGILFVATINRNPLAWLVAIFGAEYLLRWLPKGTHHWRKLVKPRELDALLTRDSMRITDTVGVRVNPFTRHFSLTQHLWVNYMLAAVRGAHQARP